MAETDPEAGRSATGPLADPVAEATRVVTRAEEHGVVLRALGGVAVAILCPSSRIAPLARGYADIDLVTVGASRNSVEELLGSMGYAADREFNILHGHRRMYFWDTENGRQIDVFVDEARLCHRIDFRARIELVPLTISPADLLLTKLQVVETNDKDMLDICAILADHDLGDDDHAVDSDYIAGLTAADWGLWRTLDMVVERSEAFAAGLMGFEAGPRVGERLRRLRGALEAIPKSRAWRLRARIGERKRWYEVPEDL
jgi:hypothetical protein